jgi:transmembrane sensor
MGLCNKVIMEESIKDSLIHRFLNKETTEQENAEILLWVSASEENRTEFRRVHRLYHLGQMQQFQSAIDVDKAWDNLNSRLPKAKREQKILRLTVFRRIAVAILTFLTIGFGSLWTKEHFFSVAKSAKIQFIAPKGDKSKIILADGTLVWLNSQTVLTYDALSPRKVTLQGEAYFEVEKDNRHPFLITTSSGMKVEVTGTRFNLRSFPEESFVETTLEEGEVRILGMNCERLIVLKPGQQSTYDIKSSQLKVQNVSAEIFSLWKNNELRFSDITFEELVPRIERWYGISIILDPRVGRNDRFTMTIKTESLRELLTMMQLTSKFKYEIKGSQVEILVK